ncbi:hypothetical protein [Ensifer sp. LBL]|uniref:hypothetical protein n=1 Tax=Ensifer sp. LBL TaxID=2991056 RepID=UPI003D1CD58D
MNKIMVSMVAACSLLGSEASANCSPGFLADVLCQAGVINQDTANGLDQVHQGLGNPLENAVPSVQGGFAQPAGGGQFQPAPMNNRFPQLAWGNYCVTPWGAVYGPPNPIGTPCTANFNGVPVQGLVAR